MGLGITGFHQKLDVQVHRPALCTWSVLCCVLLLAQFNHILQGYFIVTRAIICSSNSEEPWRICTNKSSVGQFNTNMLSYSANIGISMRLSDLNSLRLRQNGRLFADDTFKRIFLNENARISIKISLKFVPKGPINNNPALVLIMACRLVGAKPLSEPMLVRSLTHICVTLPQWVYNGNSYTAKITSL